MPGIASATGLISARIRPVRRPKPKRVELSGYCARAAPFALRPFAGLFNPYPYGCSVLCNHPADCEAKEVVRRAKDTWATEGRALLLPEEMDMIRTSLLAASGGDTAGNVGGDDEACNAEATTAAVPEELFRKYTETDSRPPTPAPTLASGPALTNRAAAAPEDPPATCNPRERTTLVLDLRSRANAQHQQLENETFSWHALILEPPPTPRRSEVSKPPISRPQHPAPAPPPSPIVEGRETGSSKNDVAKEEEEEEEEDEDEDAVDSDGGERPLIIRRRGKRLRKRKCRRGSTYGQQTEVRDPLEPTVTQVSQIGDGSRRPSVHAASTGEADGATSPRRTAAQQQQQQQQATTSCHATSLPSSFLLPDILKHLCRELDRDKVEAEFSTKRRIALEEALRAKGDASYATLRVGSRENGDDPSAKGTTPPRVFTRQAARFELLDSQSLRGLTPLRYLGRHVYVTSGRKLIFGRIFGRFNEEEAASSSSSSSQSAARRVAPNDVDEGLRQMLGRALTSEERSYLRDVIGEVAEPLGFREWCGLCAAVERLLCPLPSKENDPPTWLERADFEALERRLGGGSAERVDPALALLLKEIRDR